MNDQELRWFNNEQDKPATPKLSSLCSQTKFMLMFNMLRSQENVVMTVYLKFLSSFLTLVVLLG